jgi:hypothetical protein
LGGLIGKPLALDASQRDTLHKGLLQEEEEQNDGQSDEDGSSHEQAPFAAILRTILMQAQ